MSSPLMAGGGDSVAGVILLSFPQTGTGCRFEALVSVLQQAGSKKGPVIPFRFTDNSAQMLVHDVICIIWWLLSRGEKAQPESQGC